jgi:uncharacterized membrane protein
MKERPEPIWPPVAAVLVLIVLNLVLSLALNVHRGGSGRWAIPAVEIGLLIALIARGRSATAPRSKVRRLGIALVGLLVAAALYGTCILIYVLISGGAATNSAGTLLAYGAFVWLANNVAFALLYWEFDGGGPAARLVQPREFPDLAFPQQLNPELAPPGWRPIFWDYLYLGFNNSVAFSPTDVMPLARWAKLSMAVQALVSLAILGLVIARAVNVFT